MIFLKRIQSASAGFTLIELLVTVAIFVAMTALLVAKYGSFNDGSILTSMAYDVALALRDAQSYGLNVQDYDSSNAFNVPYGVHFDSTLGNDSQIQLFADSYPSYPAAPDGLCTADSSAVCSAGQTAGDDIITTYTIKNGGIISSVCVMLSDTCEKPSNGIVDITFKRPDPDAIITATLESGPAQTYPYAEIQVENAGKTSTRTIVVRETGEIAVEDQ